MNDRTRRDQDRDWFKHYYSRWAIPIIVGAALVGYLLGGAPEPAIGVPVVVSLAVVYAAMRVRIVGRFGEWLRKARL